MVIAKDLTGDALSVLVVNKIRRVLDVAAIRAPRFGQRRKACLQDIAIVTGALYLAEEVVITLDTVTSNMLGACDPGRAVSWPLVCQLCRGAALARRLCH